MLPASGMLAQGVEGVVLELLGVSCHQNVANSTLRLSLESRDLPQQLLPASRPAS